jgi:hypothetical protein
MRVMSMQTRGFLRITTEAGERVEALPESPLGAGEFPEACWAAPDGTVYAVGKQYTGKPGPDPGVVWRRASDGTWSMPFRLPDRSFHSITGRGPNDIVVGAIGGYVVFDGKTWTVHDLPEEIVWDVWSEGGIVVIRNFYANQTYELTDGTAKPTTDNRAKHDSYDDRYACAHGTARYRVFDRSTEAGERDLSPEEEAEIRGEMKQLENAKVRVPPP